MEQTNLAGTPLLAEIAHDEILPHEKML